MLIYPIWWTKFPNEYDEEVWVLIDVLGVVTKGYGNCKCCMLRILVDFMILLNTYCFLFWVGRWYLLNTHVLYWPLLLFFSSCLFVECSKRAVIFYSTVTQASLTTSEIQGELMLLAWTESHSSSLDALNFRHGLASYVFLAFRILLV